LITLTKLAKLANVSVSTASKAFSGSPEVNDETRELVFKTAKENGCFKKFYNVKYPKLVIAVIAPEFNSMTYTRYLTLLQTYLAAENCEICVSATFFSPEREKELLEYYCHHSNVDGIIIIGSICDLSDNFEIPVVYVDNRKQKNSSKGIDTALDEVSAYLKDKKVKSVGFIGEKLTSSKYNLTKESLAKVGINLEENFVSISEGRFEEGGYYAMEKMFSENKIPRALICAYDYMAIGAIRCIYDHGLSVPEDIAVLGMDDIPEAKYLNPPLASVSTPVEDMCKLASEAVIKTIKGETVECDADFIFRFCPRKSFEM
jgi:LacI family transcriptional regulator